VFLVVYTAKSLLHLRGAKSILYVHMPSSGDSARPLARPHAVCVVFNLT